MGALPPSTITFAIWGPIAPSDLPALCDEVCRQLDGTGATIALCDVAGADADAVTVDALARLQLVARRQGCRIQLLHASDQLRALVAFMGLEDVLTDSS
jgi:ABC-type transporter Mla MlaB component